MSEDKKIKLNYNGEIKDIEPPKDFQELKKSFLKVYQKDENLQVSFKYKNEENQFMEIKENDIEFKEFIKELSSKDELTIYIENFENTENINPGIENDKEEKIENKDMVKSTSNVSDIKGDDKKEENNNLNNGIKQNNENENNENNVENTGIKKEKKLEEEKKAKNENEEKLKNIIENQENVTKKNEEIGQMKLQMKTLDENFENKKKEMKTLEENFENKKK